MATAQQLFGDLALTRIESHALFLERARRETGRGRKATADVALSAYVVTRLIEAMLDLDEMPDSQEAFRWQRDMAARHLAALPGETAETSHLSGIVDAVAPDGGRTPALAVSLTAYAYFLEHEGRLEEALDVLALSARTRGHDIGPGETAAYAFFAGKINRLLARWQQALVCYGIAEEVGRVLGDEAVVLRGRLCQGAVARGQGNLPKARTTCEEVARQASALSLAYVQSQAYAELGVIYDLQGLPLEAIRARYAAFLIATTPADRMLALGDLGISLAEIGAYDQARLALQLVAGISADFRTRTNAIIELMNIESATGNRVAYERHRNKAEECRSDMPPSMATDYYYKVGIGLARFGQLDRSRESLAKALQTAEAHALNAWYFRVEEALAKLGVPETIQPTVQGPPDLTAAPVIHEVELGLREFSAAIAS